MTKRRSKKPGCRFYYDNKSAVYPKTDPRFCSQRCAADWAYNMVFNDIWCPEHNEWVQEGDCDHDH